MFSFERATSDRRVTWLSLVGLVLVPVIVAAGFLWATWKAGDRLHVVEAAVVNNDQAVTIDGQYVPLGRQLAGGLVDSSEENFTWTLVDAPEASSGLTSGKYAAVVTIPENFSKAATSFGDAESAEQATIDIQTSRVEGVADSAIAQTIANVAASKLGSTLTETYLDNIYLGFNKMGEQFSTVADAAGQLADGADGLSDGVGQAADGASTLATGMGQLSDAGDKMDEGGTKLVDGGDTLADGSQAYAKGVKQYTSGVGQVADGVASLADGVDQAVDKIGAPLPKEQADKLDQLVSGVKGLSTGASGVSQGLQGVVGNLDAMASAVTPRAAQAVKDAAAQAPSPTLADCPDDLKASTDPQLACTSYFRGMGDGFTKGVDAGAQGGAAGMAAAVDSALTEPQQGAPMSLSEAASQVATGAGKTATGVEQLVTSMKGMPKEIAKGLKPLVDGANKLSTGASKLDKGSAQVATGASALATGTRTSTDGVATFVAGVDEYTDGVSGASEGTAEFAAGMKQLDRGASKLAAGTTKLADGLEKGAKQVPSYSESERDNLKTVVTEPVATSTPGGSLISEAPATTLLMILALWIGALATFLVVAPVSARTVLSSRPSWQLALQAMIPGTLIAVLQSVALTIVGQVVLDLPLTKVIAVFVVLLLSGFAFVGINHALAGWWGGFGRLLSVVFVVITAAGAITSAVPTAFSALQPYSPLAPALRAVRQVVIDGGSPTGPVALVIAWLIVGVVASIGAVLRRRTLTPAQLRARVA